MPPRAAQPGEGLVIIVDVGPGVRQGDGETFYSQAKECLINILQRKVFVEKSRDFVGIVLFGTDGTKNKLAAKQMYQHVTVLREPQYVTWEMLEEAGNLPRGNSSGDWMDALIVAADLICNSGISFESKQIVLMTDFSGDFDDDHISTVVANLQKHDVDFTVIGCESMDVENDDDNDAVDGHDDDQPGTSHGRKASNVNHNLNWNGKTKTDVQLAGETLAKRLAGEVNGITCSFKTIIPTLMFFRKRSAGSMPWNTEMDIGPNLRIPVTGKIKVRHVTAPTWKRVYAHDESAVMTSEVSYHRHDDAQTPVDADDVIAGYKYGTTLVPFSDEDAKMQYSSDATRGLSVLGFTRACNISPQFRSGDQVLVLTARDGDEEGAVSLSAIIQGLAELDMVAITRRIYNKNSNPVLGVLIPDVTAEYECLIWLALPFQEDVHMFTFPSLERIIQKLTSQEKGAIDALIDEMDLSDQDENGEEILDPTQVLNPQVQHFFNVLTHRVLNPDAPLPDPAPHVLEILKPPVSVQERRENVAACVAALFPVQKVLKVVKKKTDNLFASNGDETNKRARIDDAEISVNDLMRTIVTHVTSVTPETDFMALLRGDSPNFVAICRQMEEIVLQLVDGFGGGTANEAALLTKIIRSVVTFRRECCAIDPNPFNSFMRKLKDVVVAKNLLQIWDRVSADSLGLISCAETLKSSVSAEEAQTFITLDQVIAAQAPVPLQQNDDMEDFLEDL